VRFPYVPRYLMAPGALLVLSIGLGWAIWGSSTNPQSAPAGATLIGRCALVHRGRRTQVWQTRVETEQGKLIALTSQTQMTL